MKKSIGVVHFIADCQDCDWHCENHINGQAQAAKHAKNKRHTVHYEIGLAGDYKGKED
jgi:hypothetical protein